MANPIVAVRVTQEADAGAPGLVPLPGQQFAIEIDAGLILLLDVGIDATVVAAEVGRERELMEYLSYLQRLIARGALTASAVPAQRALNFHEFIGLPPAELERARNSSQAQRMQVRYMSQSLSWLVAHQYAHAALDKVDGPPDPRRPEEERPVDELTATLLSRAEISPIPTLATLLLFAAIDHAQARTDLEAVTDCRAAQIMATGIAAAIESARGGSGSETAQADEQLRRMQARLGALVRQGRCTEPHKDD